MKFKQYLNEITTLTEDELDKIIDTIFSNFEKYMKKTKLKFWPIIAGILIKSAAPFRISVIPKFLTRIGQAKKWSNASGTADASGNITIFLEIKELRSLKNKSGVNKIKKEFRKTLSHELIHRKQFEKIKNKGNISIKDYDNNKTDYYSDKAEIESFAREAVEELKNNEGDVLLTYALLVKKQNNKAWKRFLKKLYQYIDDQSNSDKLKITLYNHLKRNSEMFEILNNDLEDIIRKFD